MPMLADEPEDGMLRCLIWRFLASHPAHGASAELLRQEADRAAAADGAPSLEQAAQQYGGVDLRALVRGAAQSAGGPALAPAPAVSATLPHWLLERESGKWWSSRSAASAPAASAALQLGPDRFGIRGFVDGHLGAAYCVACDATGQRVFTGADDGLIKVWCARTCLLLGVLRGHLSEITELSLSSGGKPLLASASNDGDVRLWALDNAGFLCVATLNPGGASSPVAGASFRPALPAHPLQVLTISAAGTLALWTDGTEDTVQDAQVLASDAAGWRMATTNTPVKSTEGYFVFEGVWSPGGARFAVGTTDEVIHVYRAPPPSINSHSAPQLVATLRGHRHDVTSVAWSSRGDALLSGSKDGTARLWRLKGRAGTGQVLGSSSASSFPGERWVSTLLGEVPWTAANPNPVLPVIGAVAWSSDDSTLVTARSDARVFVWDGRTGAALCELTREGEATAHSREVYVLKCHPTLAHVGMSASYDGTAVIWDLRSGEEIRTLQQPALDEDIELIDGAWTSQGDGEC